MRTLKEAVIDFLEKKNAFWLWGGHKHVAELTSGKLSDFFVDCTPIFSVPCEMDWVADGLKKMTINVPAAGESNLWVVGSAMGAVGLAHILARGFVAQAAYTEPVEEIDAIHPQTKKTMQLKRFDLGEKPYVILCEDVITTFGTTRRTMEGIQEKHPDVRFHDDVLAIVNRSGKDRVGVNGRLNDAGPMAIRALIDIEANVWDTQDDLPEAMKDCVPIRPRGESGNWRKLFDEMLGGECSPFFSPKEGGTAEVVNVGGRIKEIWRTPPEGTDIKDGDVRKDLGERTVLEPENKPVD